MAGKHDTIGRIERKVAQLIAENDALRRRASRLSVSKDNMREENRELLRKVAELERRVAILELREGFFVENSDQKSAKAAQARIDKMIKEVDRCLSIVNAEG